MDGYQNWVRAMYTHYKKLADAGLIDSATFHHHDDNGHASGYVVSWSR